MQNITRVAAILPFLFTTGVAHAAPVVLADPVAKPLAGLGTGLCSASAMAMNPTVDFGLTNPTAYTASVNAFIETHKADRVESVIRTLLDLSNNNSAGVKQSYGDFVDAVLPTCKTGGCDFFVNDSTTAFGMRLRGYYNVTADLANKPIHFGFFTDDTISLTFYGANNTIHPILVRPAEIGLPTWRVTEEVTFQKAGLYPLEVLYTEIAEHAALEMSYFVGVFADFERPSNQPPVVKLSDAGFTLFPPTSFFQTLGGNPSFPDLNVCRQCDRAFVNQPGNNGCDAGYYCNDAALCAPCDSNQMCGPTCSPCGGNTPHCENVAGINQCVECRTDADCANGGTCDATTHVCNGSSSTSTGGNGGDGGNGNGGSGGNGQMPGESGCSCRTTSNGLSGGMPVMLGLFGVGWGLLYTRRRRQKR